MFGSLSLILIFECDSILVLALPLPAFPTTYSETLMTDSAPGLQHFIPLI